MEMRRRRVVFTSRMRDIIFVCILRAGKSSPSGGATSVDNLHVFFGGFFFAEEEVFSGVDGEFENRKFLNNIHSLEGLLPEFLFKLNRLILISILNSLKNFLRCQLGEAKSCHYLLHASWINFVIELPTFFMKLR